MAAISITRRRPIISESTPRRQADQNTDHRRGRRNKADGAYRHAQRTDK
ncbi:MAG: hypothetical protein ABIH70_08115 [Chloroflexota bacterium]